MLDALRLVARELNGKVPLIGFAGAPFTLASYVIEGGHSRHYLEVKKLMYGEPATFTRLMDLLADTVAAYLLAQLAAGAQVLQLFDSWVGALGPYDYERFAAPWSRRVLEAVGGRGAPVIHFVNGASAMLPLVGAAGGDVVGIDWRIDLDRARDELGEGVAVQGNLDPVALLGPVDQLEERVADVMRRAGGRPGHVFNLGHGVLPADAPRHGRATGRARPRLAGGALTAAPVDVALLAFGGPESVAEVGRFIAAMTGASPRPEVVAAVTRRYQAIGGGSPLPDMTRRQAAALQLALNARIASEVDPLSAGSVRVRPGFLYCEPTVAQCLAGLDARHTIVLPLSPYSSRLTTGAYRAALAAAGHPELPFLDGWYADPRYLAALSHRVNEAIDGADPNEFALLLTAHNVPLDTVTAGDPYVDQLRETAARLRARPHARDLAPGLPEQGPARRRVARARGRHRRPRVRRGRLEEAPGRAPRLRLRPCGDALRPRHRTARDRRLVGHGLSALPRPERLAGLHRGARRSRGRLSGSAGGSAPGRRAVSDHVPLIAVIGGGMAGLGAAHALETARRAAAAVMVATDAGAATTSPAAAAPDWILFERADYLGGKVRTERVDGFVIEGGPDSFIVEKPWPMELARAVGIYDRLLDSNEDIRKSYVYSGGRLHELPEGLILMVPTRLVPFAVSSLVSWRGKLRMGLDLLLPRGPSVTATRASASSCDGGLAARRWPR